MSDNRSFFANPYNYLAVSGIVPGAILGGMMLGPIGAVAGGIVGGVASGMGTTGAIKLRNQGWKALEDGDFAFFTAMTALAVPGFFIGASLGGHIVPAFLGLVVGGMAGLVGLMVSVIALMAVASMFSYIEENTSVKPVAAPKPEVQPTVGAQPELSQTFAASNQNNTQQVAPQRAVGAAPAL